MNVLYRRKSPQRRKISKRHLIARLARQSVPDILDWLYKNFPNSGRYSKLQGTRSRRQIAQPSALNVQLADWDYALVQRRLPAIQAFKLKEKVVPTVKLYPRQSARKHTRLLNVKLRGLDVLKQHRQAVRSRKRPAKLRLTDLMQHEIKERL